MTAQQLWEDWWAKVRPPECTHLQAVEMKKAFICGLFCMLDSLINECGEDKSDDAIVLRMDLMHSELINLIKQFQKESHK